MKKILLIMGIIFSILLLSGCTDRGNLVTNSITGTLGSVTLTKNENIEIRFVNNSYGILTVKKIDSDGTNWYNVLQPLIGKNIKLTWIANYDQVVIAYIEVE